MHRPCASSGILYDHAILNADKYCLPSSLRSHSNVQEIYNRGGSTKINVLYAKSHGVLAIFKTVSFHSRNLDFREGAPAKLQGRWQPPPLNSTYPTLSPAALCLQQHPGRSVARAPL